jgi:hypothetical protein
LTAPNVQIVMFSIQEEKIENDLLHLIRKKN